GARGVHGAGDDSVSLWSAAPWRRFLSRGLPRPPAASCRLSKRRQAAALQSMMLVFVTMCATQQRHLTLDEKIGQMFAVRAYGVFMGESSPAYQQLLHQVRDNHVGGVVWFLSN